MHFAVHKKRKLLYSLISRKRVDITPPNYLIKTKLYLFVFMVTNLVTISALIISFGITYMTLGITTFTASFSALIIGYVIKHAQTISIKGGTLITHSMAKRSSVMSLRSIRNVKSKGFFGIEFTTIKYNLDGQNKSTIIINRNNSVPATPERSIKKAIQIYKKEKKANHKPGSVMLTN